MSGRLILASASPRRRELLAQIAITPDEIVPAALDEAVARAELPVDYARRIAAAKAAAVAARYGDDYVLGADTVVAVGRRILGKPADAAGARVMLGQLSGRRHRVIGAICVIAPGGARAARLVTTTVRFKRLEADEIDRYIANDEWRDKAGAYAIQGRAAAFIAWIGGSYSNVVGLALAETHGLLVGLGYRGGEDRGED